MATQEKIRDRLAAGDAFSLAEVRRWMAEPEDLALWSTVYDVLGTGWKLIRPEPDMTETCMFMTRYLLRCVRENVQADDSTVPTGYEAAWTLAGCLKHWAAKLPETQEVMAEAASKVAEAYRAGDDAERDRLLNGTLEHAMESPPVRSYFEHWRDDPVLSKPWQMAIEWAGNG